MTNANEHYTDNEQAEAEAAVRRSASHDEIVTLEYSEGLAYLLAEWCEDWTDAGNVREYYASAEHDADDNFAGGAWRVHLLLGVLGA